MTWRRARAVETLEAQLRREVPGIVLGDIGDAAHAAEGSGSDHNPWLVDAAGVGVVRAVDIMHPPNGDALAANLAAKLGYHPAMKSGAYVIWNRRIMSADRKSEGWRAYTGSSPHTDHVHVSITTIQSGYDSPAAWGSLTSGSGVLGGVQPGVPVTSTSVAYNSGATGVGAAGGVTNAALSSVVPDADALRRLVIYGLALFGGVALIGVGLAKTIRPHTDALEGQVQDAAMNLLPQGRAAGAAKSAAATKGV